jgi:lipopolysaccharide transport system permease protein
MTLTAPATTSRAAPRQSHLWDLVWTLVRTDFATRYHGTVGGFLWALLKPLAMFVVLMSVFSFVFPNTPQYRIGLILGLFLYEFFQDGTRVGLESLRAKGYLITKAKFPSWVLVVTATSNAVITLMLVSVVLITFLVASGRGPGPAAVALYAWYLFNYFAVITGFALAASVLFMQFRDLNQVWEVVTQAGFFLAPVVYPIDALPERLHIYLYLWPPTPIILFSRSVLVEGKVPSALAHGLLTLEAVVVLAVGAAVYRARSPRVAEYL